MISLIIISLPQEDYLNSLHYTTVFTHYYKIEAKLVLSVFLMLEIQEKILNICILIILQLTYTIIGDFLIFMKKLKNMNKIQIIILLPLKCQNKKPPRKNEINENFKIQN